jgi:site-specific DNA-methyltransferase (adenine-specific)
MESKIEIAGMQNRQGNRGPKMTLSQIKQSIKQEPFYECEDGVLYCADCMDILPQLPEGCVDLTVTSPPYDNLRDYKGYSFDFEGIAFELYRITKNGGVVVWVVADQVFEGSESGTSFRQALHFKDLGFRIHDTMIYWKNSFAFPESNRYAQNFEYMFVFSKGSPFVANIARVPTYAENRIKSKASSYRDADGKTRAMEYEIGKDKRNRENIWAYECGYMKTTKDIEAYGHPAMFPEALAEDHILSWSNEGDLVLDCFSGAGTTGKMASKNNRRFIGIEISEEYCRIAKDRIQAEQKGITVAELKRGQKVLF